MRSRLRLIPCVAVLILGACSAPSQLFSSGWDGLRPAARNLEEAARANWGNDYERGKALLAQGLWGSAIVAFRNALARGGDPVAVLNGLGIAYDGLRRFDIALAYYRAALNRQPDSAITLNNLANSMMRAGRFVPALAYAERAKAAAAGGREDPAGLAGAVNATLEAARTGQARATAAQAGREKAPPPRRLRIDRGPDGVWVVSRASAPKG